MTMVMGLFLVGMGASRSPDSSMYVTANLSASVTDLEDYK